MSAGGRFGRGQPIGAVIYTGNANPAALHLHFEIGVTSPDRNWYEHGRAINPYPLLTHTG